MSEEINPPLYDYNYTKGGDLMDTDYRRAANITIIVAGAVFFFWLVLKYALGALTPFLISAAVAAIISPLADKISKRSGIARKAIAVVLVLIVFLAVGSLIYLGISRLAEELQGLLERLESDPDGIGMISDKISEKLKNKTLTLKDINYSYGIIASIEIFFITF